MTDRVALERLQEIWDRVAGLLLRAAASDAAGRPWRLGYLDVRGAPGTSVRLQKWRVELVDGQVLPELDVPPGVSALMLDAYDLRNGAFADKWYGVLMTVYPDERCEMKFDYDPGCVKKGFFDT